MNVFTTVFFYLSSALLVPVVVLLIGLFGWSLMTLGGFFREYMDRYRPFREASRQGEISTHQNDNERLASVPLGNDSPADPCSRRLEQISADCASMDEANLRMDEFLDAIELQMAGRLDKTDLACRVAPMLGLMGTLIPLAPALMALAEGDVQTLAKNLVVAFTTTVIGLASSAIFLWVSTVRRRWYDRDLRELTQIANRLLHAGGKEGEDELFSRKMDAAKEFSQTSSL